MKASNAPSRQEGWFEVMVGKSLPRAGTGQVFAFVHRLEAQPTERMERFLAEQGVFPAQPTTFLSDGGETVRQAQGEFRQFGEPILDWFHVAMRMTQLSQAIKGLPADPSDEQDPAKHVEECLRILRRAKAYLWHGSPHRALQTLEDLTWEIGTESDHANAMQDKLEEFMGYVTANLTLDPELCGPPPARRAHRDRLRRIRRQPSCQQAACEETADAVDPNRAPTSCCRSGPACSISSCAVISSAGTRASSPLPSRFVWRRSTRNGPLSPQGAILPPSISAMSCLACTKAVLAAGTPA